MTKHYLTGRGSKYRRCKTEESKGPFVVRERTETERAIPQGFRTLGQIERV